MNASFSLSYTAKRGSLPLILLLLALLPTSLHAARVGDLFETNVIDQAWRFFSFRDPALRITLLGCILLGLNCGLLGSFVVVRRMSLVGDTLSHAVLPGIALGFLWNMSKDPLVILIAATAAGGLAMLTVTAITRTTRLKDDAAMGMVLSSFYAIGICLVTMIQRLPTGQKSGIDKFLFGQAAALTSSEITLLAITAVISLTFILYFYRNLLLLSFHEEFGESLGLNMRLLHFALMLLTAFAVVTAMQAVGVVLVSAMLIIPAATAYLLTDRMHLLMVIAAAIGVCSAVIGAFLSFLGSNLPTGPFMVLSGAGFFTLAFLFSPRHGWLTRALQHHSRQRRTERENTLKTMYHVLEDRDFQGDAIPLIELAQRRRETLEEITHRARALQRAHLATFNNDTSSLLFTPQGLTQAKTIVRNHRLWELYLTNVMSYESDHVHDDAEKIEHLIDEHQVRHLQRRLDFPETDPHGKEIPKVHPHSHP